MGHFLRLRALWFLVGFVAAFLTYLLIKYEPNEIIDGMLIGVAAGAVLSALLFVLEHVMRDRKRENEIRRDQVPSEPPPRPIERI